MKFKKKISVLAVIAALAIMTSGCSPIVMQTPEAITVYATFYPIYALADMLCENVPDFDLQCLVQPQDGCLRNYSLSDWDIYMLAYSADGVISGGCGLESFSDQLETMAQDQIALAEVLAGTELYQPAASQQDAETHFIGENPHLYMSVSGSMEIAENIYTALSVMDARYLEIYKENLDSVLSELRDIQTKIQKQTEVCTGMSAVIMNEATFYTANDMGLEISACITRESGEGFYDAALENCIREIRESGAELILIEQQAPQMLVSALESEGFAVVKLDVMSGHSASEGSKAYLDALVANADAVAAACMSMKSEGNH